MAPNASYKNPPLFDGETGYASWKKDVMIWCELTDLDETKRALALHLSLTGRARVATSELELSQMQVATGVKTLLEKLDGLFEADKGRRQFALFNDLYNSRRSNTMNISDFVAEFEHTYFKFQKEEMSLPDAVKAFMLLSACNLSDCDVQLVMSAITDVTYDRMKAAIKRIFGTTASSSLKVQQDIKPEPVFHSDAHLEPTLYTQSSRRGRGRGGFRGRWRPRQNASFSSQSNASTGRRMNPLDSDGEVSRCMVCDSKFHWARDCPHSYENNSKFKNPDEDKVLLSLFMGLNDSIDKEDKINVLVEESRGAAVLDTGCVTTVTGQAWLDNYISGLSEYERGSLSESSSSASFTFGDGRSFPSIKKLLLPCWIGNQRASITTDVVSCNIPLLMSGSSMKKANMVWDFGNDCVEIGPEEINLKRSSSGHFLLPLSL